jgi:uncharacterized protein (TIGR02145 family)
MKDYSRMQFVLPEQGETMITFHDLSGKEIAQTRDMLSKGQHTYAIQDVEEGIYFVTISSGRYSLSGKLISSGSKNGSAKIAYESSAISQEKQGDSKGTNEEKVMQYNTGDRLKLIGISGIYSTVVTDVPTASKTITYNFIACTDGDGNHYPIVQISSSKGTTGNTDLKPDIGTQTWMALNLRTTKYTDGTDIPNVTDGTTWSGLTTPAYCWYDNNIVYKNIYGASYNGFTADTGILCPDGFHVPRDSDWTVLTDYLGGITEATSKLKETGTIHWVNSNYEATNESGFTALPGGMRSDNDGSFKGVGSHCCWWSSTEGIPHKNDSYKGSSWHSSQSSIPYAWYRIIYYLDSWVHRDVLYKARGFSVRCMRD